MASSRGRSLQGALLIDKPAGPTSHDVVAFVRRVLNVDRAGHTGTLDPLATGLLIVLVGSATRLAQFLGADEKEYLADVRIGVATATYDAASLHDSAPVAGGWTRDAPAIGEVLSRFRGTFLQTPPPYSAKKVGSVPAYERARKNQGVELTPVEVTVRELEVLEWPLPAPGPRLPASGSDVSASLSPLLRLRVAASAGFYVRSLAHDIGQALGCGAHLETLRRTRAGRFRVEDAMTLDRLESEAPARLISPSELLGHMPAVFVTEIGDKRVTHGNPLASIHLERADNPLLSSQTQGAVPLFRVLNREERLVAVAEPRAGGVLQPIVVLR